MNKAIRSIQTYLIFGLPFVLIGIIFGSTSKGNFLIRSIQELLSWNLMLWFTVLVFFLILLVVMPNVRELTLRRLANIKDADEREDHITGKASRVTYVSMLSIMILLFFSSIFSVTINKLPENQTYNGRHHVLNLNLAFKFLEDHQSENKAQTGLTLFDSKNIVPLSKSSILLLLICWELLVFNWSERTEQLKGFK